MMEKGGSGLWSGRFDGVVGGSCAEELVHDVLLEGAGYYV
jgi:hypothetical protein